MTRSHAFAGCIQSGTGFPDGWGFGKCVPEFAFVMGCSFPTEPQAETASHSGREFWDTVSGCKKGHMTWPSTYICSAGVSMTSRASTPRRLPGDAERKVHRELRTQRRPLNVASVLRRTVRAGNLICLRPDRRFSYELAASRYLILVVPGAKLGSVSLASVWKCSVYTFLPSRNIS